tara:strand:+ start:65 stop:394 length:330 start_codon:yes stop_codon:yes gene_type:complete
MSSPDTKKLNVKEMKKKINYVQNKISELVKENKNNVDIEMYFLENDSEFYERYPYLIKKLIKGGSLEFLDVMLNNLEKVESGQQTMASTELKLGEDLASKYLYPKVNKD